MALSVSGIKTRLQASFGAAQDTTIQNISLSALAQALYNIFTLYPALSTVVGIAGTTATGSILVPAGTFLTAFQSAFAPAQNTTIQTTELTKLASGIEASLTLDAQASYPLSSGAVFNTFTISNVTAAQALTELQNAFGAAQDNTIRDSTLTPMASALVTGLLSCT